MTVTIITDNGIEETFDVEVVWYDDCPSIERVYQDGKLLPSNAFSGAEIERIAEAVIKQAKTIDDEEAWDKMIDLENEKGLQ